MVDTLRRSLIILVALSASSWLLVAALASQALRAQEDVASAIVDAPAVGFEPIDSQRVDVSAIDPDRASQIADAWLKSFSDGLGAISIVATQFTDRDALRAGLAGAMAQIPLEERHLVPGHDGVVAGPVRQGGVEAQMALYGQGTISFVIAVLGTDRDSVLAEAVASQTAHSTGELFDLHVDETERFLAEADGDQVWYWVGGGAIVVIAGAVLALRRIGRRSRKRA